jgi:hypothetical protein
MAVASFAGGHLGVVILHSVTGLTLSDQAPEAKTDRYMESQARCRNIRDPALTLEE